MPRLKDMLVVYDRKWKLIEIKDTGMDEEILLTKNEAAWLVKVLPALIKKFPRDKEKSNA